MSELYDLTSLDMLRNLPLELWAYIIQHLPVADQKSCLFVSRQFHDLTIPVLFSHVTLYFGLWSIAHLGHDMDEDAHDEWLDEENRRENITWEVLWHISTTPSFARIVKAVTVKACSSSSYSVFGVRKLPSTL